MCCFHLLRDEDETITTRGNRNGVVVSYRTMHPRVVVAGSVPTGLYKIQRKKFWDPLFFVKDRIDGTVETLNLH